ncbi:MAG: SH3 domain-containing protein [Steroidobacteraceae bacterium]|nr:SH3 domain-containing protein [Steroidobacteraceae bacterium]
MKSYSNVLRVVAALLAGSLLAAGAQAQILGTKKGKGGSEVQGAAGTQGAQGAASDLQRCDKPMGAIAVVEPQDYVMAALSRYNLQSPVSLIRMMIQQSNCFIVVERGQGMQNMMQERALAGGGELRGGSNIGGGQMVAADFILTPAVVFSESNAGGVGGALGGLLGGRGSAIGAVVGGLKFKEAQTSMLVADARSGVQVAAAEGSSKKADLALGAAIFGGGAGGGIGGYGNTNEGKIIAASFADNYNNIVSVIRNDPNLQRDVGSLAQEAAAGGKTKAGAVYNDGDVVMPKIAGIKLMGTPGEAGKVVATLAKGDELIYMGEEQDGWLKVESGKGGGWVKKILVAK